MALVKCLSCGKEVSDKANACPKCGTPIGQINDYIIENKQYINTNNEKVNGKINSKILDGMFWSISVLLLISLFMRAIYAKTVILGKTYETFNLTLITSDYGKIILIILIIEAIITLLISLKKIKSEISKIKILFPIGIAISLFSCANSLEDVFIDINTYLFIYYEIGFGLACICCVGLFIEALLRFCCKDNYIVYNNNSNNNEKIDINDLPPM